MTRRSMLVLVPAFLLLPTIAWAAEPECNCANRGVGRCPIRHDELVTPLEVRAPLTPASLSMAAFELRTALTDTLAVIQSQNAHNGWRDSFTVRWADFDGSVWVRKLTEHEGYANAYMALLVFDRHQDGKGELRADIPALEMRTLRDLARKGTR